MNRPTSSLIGHKEGIGVITGCWAPDNSILVTSSTVGTMLLWKGEDLVLDAPGASLVMGGQNINFVTLAIHPLGQLLAAGCTDNSVMIWDLVTGQPKVSCFHHTSVPRVCIFNTNGSILTVTLTLTLIGGLYFQYQWLEDRERR